MVGKFRNFCNVCKCMTSTCVWMIGNVPVIERVESSPLARPSPAKINEWTICCCPHHNKQKHSLVFLTLFFLFQTTPKYFFFLFNITHRIDYCFASSSSVENEWRWVISALLVTLDFLFLFHFLSFGSSFFPKISHAFRFWGLETPSEALSLLYHNENPLDTTFPIKHCIFFSFWFFFSPRNNNTKKQHKHCRLFVPLSSLGNFHLTFLLCCFDSQSNGEEFCGNFSFFFFFQIKKRLFFHKFFFTFTFTAWKKKKQSLKPTFFFSFSKQKATRKKEKAPREERIRFRLRPQQATIQTTTINHLQKHHEQKDPSFSLNHRTTTITIRAMRKMKTWNLQDHHWKPRTQQMSHPSQQGILRSKRFSLDFLNDGASMTSTTTSFNSSKLLIENNFMVWKLLFSFPFLFVK